MKFGLATGGVGEGRLASESRPFEVEWKGRADAMVRIAPGPLSFLTVS
jgi:hypothetical protein